MTNPSTTSRLILWILLTGLLAGFLDGSAAAILYFIRTGKNPVAVYEFIASGVFGRDAFTGDPVMPVLGLMFHFFIAMTWTALFFLAYPKVERMQQSPVANAIGYGACIWLFMNLVVLPVSNVPAVPFKISSAIIGMVVLMVCIGLPVSFMARRYYGKP